MKAYTETFMAILNQLVPKYPMYTYGLSYGQGWYCIHFFSSNISTTVR